MTSNAYILGKQAFYNGSSALVGGSGQEDVDYEQGSQDARIESMIAIEKQECLAENDDDVPW